MGVHDYWCYGCGTPRGYDCGEKEGRECEERGIGNDEAHLHFYRFARPGSPQVREAFLAARETAREVSWLKAGYDWGDWDFRPVLDYRGLLFDVDSKVPVWKINDLEGGPDDAQIRNYCSENDVEIERDLQTTIWVVNYCPDCYRLFHQPAPDEHFCQLYLEAVAQEHGLTPPCSAEEIRSQVPGL